MKTTPHGAGIPELTVVIPTRNRQETAVESVRQAAAVGPASQVQIVVHDCSDEPLLSDMLSEAGLRDRVDYLYTSDKISMTENWNRAMEYVGGEYVTIIGDDDAVLPDIVTAVRWAKENGLDAVKASQYTIFIFPGVGHPLGDALLRVPPFRGSATVLRTADVLPRAALTGDGYVDLPMIYHGFVRTSVLHRIRERSGMFFGSLSPDIYAAFAIATELDRFGVLDYPFTIYGSSPKSNSGRIFNGLLYQHLAEFRRLEVHWIVPETYSFGGSYADSAAWAFSNLGREDLLQLIDVPRVFARTIFFEPRMAAAHVRRFMHVCRRLNRNLVVELTKLFGMIAAKAVIVALRKLRGVPRAQFDLFSPVESLAAAVDVQRRWLAEHRIHFAAASQPDRRSRIRHEVDA